MKPLDDELRSALQRREPPAGFEERLLARIAREKPPAERGWLASLRGLVPVPRLRWVAAGVMACLFIVAGAYRYRQIQRERAEGEMAKAQVMKAMHLASSKLNVALRKAHAIEHRLPAT